MSHTRPNGKPFERKFRPIEIGIVIDNLVTNATKAKASSVHFSLSLTKGLKPTLIIEVGDDGTGWKVSPLDRVFEKGVTTTDGSGLGLFHVKQVIEGLGGTIQANSEPLSDRLDGAHLHGQKWSCVGFYTPLATDFGYTQKTCRVSQTSHFVRDVRLSSSTVAFGISIPTPRAKWRDGLRATLAFGKPSLRAMSSVTQIMRKR